MIGNWEEFRWTRASQARAGQKIDISLFRLAALDNPKLRTPPSGDRFIPSDLIYREKSDSRGKVRRRKTSSRDDATIKNWFSRDFPLPSDHQMEEIKWYLTGQFTKYSIEFCSLIDETQESSFGSMNMKIGKAMERKIPRHALDCWR